MNKIPKITVNEVRGTVEFRHPVALGSNGYPKKVMKGFKGFSLRAQAEIRSDLQTLLTLAPLELDAVKSMALSTVALSWYFGAIPGGRISSADIDAFNASAAGSGERDGDSGDGDPAMGLDAAMIVHGLRGKIALLEADVLAKQLTIEMLQKTLGLQSTHTKSLTLSDAFEHFKKHFTASTVARTKEVVSSVLDVLTSIGLGVKATEIQQQHLERVLPVNLANVEKKSKNIKTFFEYLSRNKQENGLELRNPSTYLKIVRPARKDMELLDPKEVLARCSLTLWQQCIVALCGWAGARITEAALVCWSDVDFDTCIIGLKGTKTERSRRPVKPFPNIWSYLRAYKQACQDTTGMLFYRDSGGRVPWVETRDGQTSSPKLSQMMTAAIKAKFTFKDPDAMPTTLLRHYWQTEIQKNPATRHLTKHMGGHSQDVADKFYTDALGLAQSATIEAL